MSDFQKLRDIIGGKGTHWQPSVELSSPLNSIQNEIDNDSNERNYTFYAGDVYTTDWNINVVVPEPGTNNDVYNVLCWTWKNLSKADGSRITFKIYEDGIYKTGRTEGVLTYWFSRSSSWKSTPGLHTITFEAGYSVWGGWSHNIIYLKDRILKYYHYYRFIAVPL